jgi:hypothetical protein
MTYPTDREETVTQYGERLQEIARERMPDPYMQGVIECVDAFKLAGAVARKPRLTFAELNS